MINSVEALVELHEGRRSRMYRDSLGYWTIGVGHLIDPAKGGGLPAPIVTALRDFDINESRTALVRSLSWFPRLSEVRQAVLIDMCFNLGPEPFDNDGFKDWPIFLGQVERGEYAAAARNMLSTKWASQVGARATRLATMLETNAWPT